jgi:polyribonucleotide nucleotidyltransferase
METGIFERTHGSALFQRGETQSLVSCTLGTGRDEQIVDGLVPEYSKKFYLHYNFPPFCVGEAGRIMGPGRREIGHGALAERSLLGILPSPRTSPTPSASSRDITESNGSSSMASVCGGCLALMDAGVPIVNTCAGISVGRFTDENGGNEVFVTDILGEEDFFGDMDFKVSGTRDGITGIQLDLKARGLNLEPDRDHLRAGQAGPPRDHRADGGRHRRAPRRDLPLRPAHHHPPDRPREDRQAHRPGRQDHPRPAGQVRRQHRRRRRRHRHRLLSDGEKMKDAEAEISAICEEIKPGTIYNGKVVSVKDFGAFIEIAPGTDGMCHISELADGYVEKVADVVKVGDEVKVKVILVDDQGRIKLSRKQAMPKDESPESTESADDAEPVGASD